jgi:hypothetical protein
MATQQLLERDLLQPLAALRDCGALNLVFALHFSTGNGNKFRGQLMREQHSAVDQGVADALNTDEDFSFDFDQ